MSQMLMEAAPATEPAALPESPATGEQLGPRWLPPLVLLASLMACAAVYSSYWQHSRDLWWSMGHDRHSHYMYGLKFAFDMRTLDIVRFLHDFDGMRVWGPLHPLLVGFIQLIAGPDHRLAVLPSLAGWVLAIWCAFLIPRRLLTTGGNIAGLLAAFLVMVSPAHRAYAIDCMYESLGAGLSLAALYLYLVVLQGQTRRAAIMLGLTLTALFLHKYNYWLLVCFALIAAEFLRQPRAWLQYGLSLCRLDRLPAWALGEFKQPLNYIALAFAGAAVYVLVTGGGVVTLGSWSFSI